MIHTAPHPNWGSSGIELTDLDGDGDADVLLAHGDTFDDSLLKPYHGIDWLENRGAYPFTPHTLARMPGAHRARAIDLDGDGDLDVVASAFVADGGGPGASSLPSLVWLEQVRKGVFERRTLEKGALHHPTLAVGDVNADGKADIIVGNMATAGSSGGVGGGVGAEVGGYDRVMHNEKCTMHNAQQNHGSKAGSSSAAARGQHG